MACDQPRLLDLFCGAGGAAMGYHRAGFEVVGVDINPQPNYPFEFHQADALDFLGGVISVRPDRRRTYVIHASPPCQAFTAYQRTGNVGDYPDLIDATRQRLIEWGGPWVIENVVGAPLVNPVLICGTMFDPPMEIQRHRLFETNWGLKPPEWPCRHSLNGPDRYPGGRSVERTGTSTGLVRRTVEVGSWDIPLAKQRQAMGIDWMTLPELSEAIPPAYTEAVGAQLLANAALSAEAGDTDGGPCVGLGGLCVGRTGHPGDCYVIPAGKDRHA
jgi:DNA (cytosine-5)-methyltransferase 1